MRTAIATLVSTLALVLALTTPSPNGDVAGQEKKPEAKATPAEIEKLIKQLGSANPKTRETATAALRKIGEEALPALKVAAKAEDLELRRRADALHQEIQIAINEARRNARFTRATEWGIDYFVARLVRNREKISEDDWEIIDALAEKLKSEARTRGVKSLLKLNLAKLERVNTNVYDKKDDIVTLKCLAADVIKADVITDCMIVCKTSLDDSSALDGAVVIAGNGSRLRFGGTNHSIFICDGDFTVETSFVHSIIVAKGNVKISQAQKTMIIAGGKITARSTIDCVIREESSRVIDEIGFFSPKMLGMDVIAREKVLLITGVTPDSLMETSGLKARDKILKVDGEATTTVHQLQRLLFEKALADKAVLMVERDSESKEIQLFFKRN